MNRFLVAVLCLFITSKASHALILEDLVNSEKLVSTFQGKRIGFYVGSFDPLHKGHEALANDCIEKNLCDFVILYPAWNGDSYKKRVDITLRQDMVFSVFKDHPTIIVTRLTPADFQNTLTIETNQTNLKGRKIVKPKFNGTQFIGIMGSDTALALGNNEDALAGFMTGIKIPEKYSQHTLGGLMSLPVSTFIVKIREKDNLSSLHGSVGKRKIIAVVKNEDHLSASSTAMKKLLKAGNSIGHLVSKPVIEIIEAHNLYSEYCAAPLKLDN